MSYMLRSATGRLRTLVGRLRRRPQTLADRLTDADRARIDAAEHECVRRLEEEVRR